MDQFMIEHAWNSGMFPRARLGLTLDDHQACILGDAVDAAAEFVASFERRFIRPGTTFDHYPQDRGVIGVGMTLSGPPGRGKTSLACAIATEVLTRYRASIYFAPAADYARAWSMRYSKDVTPDASQWFNTMCNRVENAGLLVIDDIGAEHASNSGAGQNEFSRILRHRFRQARPTILTTNLGPNGWSEVYGPATADFLHEAAPTITMSGPNLRRRE